jgi:PHD/YefM family antitoxin component YafN of YafNO toxin-antitoxin module
MSQSSVRYLGSRELHRELPRILEELNDPAARLVLTIHSRPKAVIIGADAFVELVQKVAEVDGQLGETLQAMLNDASGKLVSAKSKTKSTEAKNNGRQTRTSDKTRRRLNAKHAS